MAKGRRKSLVGIVWSGFIGEYKGPPIYIISDIGENGREFFIDKVLTKFLKKKVRITIEELGGGK